MPVLGWPPDVFWRASMMELFAAIKGWQRANGAADDDSQITPDDHNELRRLVAKYG
ncbi:phage tail assembly chaperone [Pseudovibrio exalbescens]|uniref:phage tail assembly chaperone n=2 Tax=Hyphomicrobiales TaxID=356 RepID=UPI000A64C67A|nr:phage tail assembly chaperone [Pseudovibrio exalbescens]